MNLAVANYPNLTVADVAPAAFESYRGKQKFNSMMMIKAFNEDIVTLHFDYVTPEVIQQLSMSTIYLSGQQRGTSLQASFR